MIYGNDEEESEEEQDETLAEPEFTGLWSREYALNKVKLSFSVITSCFCSKFRFTWPFVM